MAENILGLLFVTSSSRGRSVYRYPPDPFSPHTRLSQPIYPSATYTAKDTAVGPVKRELFPLIDNEGRKSSNASIKSAGQRFMKAWAYGGVPEADEAAMRYSSGSDNDSSATSDSELDVAWAPSVTSPTVSKRELDGPIRVNGKPLMEGHNSVRFDTTQRDSPGNDVTANGHSMNGMDGDHDRFIESQYDHALTYPLDFLSDMLTPSRSVCHRKFEVYVDEVVFIGHPVSVGPDGKWEFPKDEDEEVGHATRGRRGRDERSLLGTVLEIKEGNSPDGVSDKTETSVTRSNGDDKEGPPTLNMFHLVLIVDKPDPKAGGSDAEGMGTSSQMNQFDEIYREIAFKWTAAAFALQVKDNFIAREAWEIGRMREKCLNEGIPILECCRMIYEKNSLDRSLNQLFTAIHQVQTKPVNPLYTHLPTTITVKIADIPVSMVLSPRSTQIDEVWAHWGEIEHGSSVEDEEDESDGDWVDGPKFSDLRVEPWQTLLLIDDDAAEDAHEISRALVGLGVSEIGVDVDVSEGTSSAPMLSRQESSAEEDEGLLMKSLIETCDVSKRLVDIAHLLRFDLDGIIIPLARELVQNKKAILVDVMNTRLRTTVMPTTITEHSLTLEQYSARFAKHFSTLPTLPAFIAMISAAPNQFREILPTEASSTMSIRQLYLDALIWLLKHDLVVQVHTRARIYARAEVKETAWRKLWHRRRERWLSVRRKSSSSAKSTKSPMTSPDDLITPRATEENRFNPMEASVPPPKIDASFMEYDLDLEMDSDLNEDDAENSEKHEMVFSMNETEPKTVPRFEGSFIFKPARAQKDEARWLRVIREPVEEVWASKFDLCVQYFDGIATFEEISYRSGMQRRELDKILQLFPDDLVTFLHP